jgi:hypothetical protein
LADFQSSPFPAAHGNARSRCKKDKRREKASFVSGRCFVFSCFAIRLKQGQSLGITFEQPMTYPQSIAKIKSCSRPASKFEQEKHKVKQTPSA